MAIDVSGLMKSLGMAPIGRTDQTTGSNVYNKAATAAKPAGGAGAFAKNVASSAAKFASGAVGAVAGGIAKDITTTARGITQGLPGLGTIDRNQGAFDMRMRDISRAQETFTKQYRQGKISRERYTKLLQDLNKDQQSANKLLQDEAKGYTKPADFAKSLAVTGTLPLAAGRLVSPALAAKSPMLATTSSIGGVAGKAGAQSFAGAAKAAALAPLKSATMYAPTAQSATEIPGQIQRGDYKGAATNAAILAAPLGIAATAKALPAVGKAVSTAVYGKGAGPIKTLFGDKLNGIDSKTNILLRQAEEFTLNQKAVGGDKGKAAIFFKDYVKNVLKEDIDNLTPQQFASSFAPYAKTMERMQKLQAKGVVPKDLVVTADFRKAIPELQKAILAAEKSGGLENAQDRINLAKSIVKELGVENKKISNLLGEAVAAGGSTDEIIARINNIGQKQIFKVKGIRAPKGFAFTPGPKERAVMPSLGKSAPLDEGKAASPIFGKIGKVLEKAGLSTQGKSSEVYAKYKMNLDDELTKIGLDPKDVLEKLTDYTRKGRGGVGIFDERQLGTSAMKAALGEADSAKADAVRKAIVNAYNRVSLGDLGLAGKIENALYKVPGYGGYRRIQGIGRYEYNPFFRLQSAVEAELLSQNVAKGKVPHLPGTNYLRKVFNSKGTDRLEKSAQKLLSHLDEGYAGEGVADNSYGVGITAKLFTTQKLSLGGLVETLAKKSGQSVDDFIRTADPKVLNNIRSVVQYPKDGYLSSNFAKTLNMAIFPSRYTTKLAMITGKALADMPPLLQIGTLKGISNFQDFLSSDEGIKWKSENSEVIGMLNYLNPLNNIGKIVAGVKNKDLQISDIGLIGGLPLGVITQLIKTQTGAMAGTPYQNPKTGELIFDDLPANAQGRVKLAIIDMINTMYSYSGRTFGFDLSKKEITGSLPGLKLDKGDTKKNTNQKPSANQERVQRVLKSGSSTQKPTTPVPTSKKATVYGKGDSLPVSPGLANRLSAAKAEAAAKKAKKGKKAKPKAFKPRPL